MGWRRVADILTGMQARDVVVKASYAKALREEGVKVKTDTRTELEARYESILKTSRQYPRAEEERQAFLAAYPAMKGVEFQQRMRVCPTPLLRGYVTLFYAYISEMKLEEAEEAVKVPIPDTSNLPKIPWPDFDPGGIKKSAQVTGLVVMGFVALVVYLMFRGGAGRDLTVVT